MRNEIQARQQSFPFIFENREQELELEWFNNYFKMAKQVPCPDCGEVNDITRIPHEDGEFICNECCCYF